MPTTRLDGRSKRIRRVLSIVGACLFCMHVVPIPAICHGRCVRGRPVLWLHRALTAFGWSLRDCRQAALCAAFGQSPSFPRRYLMFGSGSLTSSRSRSPAGMPSGTRGARLVRSSHRLCTCVYVQTRARGVGRDNRRDDHSR